MILATTDRTDHWQWSHWSLTMTGLITDNDRTVPADCMETHTHSRTTGCHDNIKRLLTVDQEPPGTTLRQWWQSLFFCSVLQCFMNSVHFSFILYTAMNSLCISFIPWIKNGRLNALNPITNLNPKKKLDSKDTYCHVMHTPAACQSVFYLSIESTFFFLSWENYFTSGIKKTSDWVDMEWSSWNECFIVTEI